MPQATKPSEQVVDDSGEPRGHDGAAQPSLSYRAFNIELDSLLPYEEFFDSTFSYDWTDGVPDHQPLQADSENQLLSTSSTIPTYDQALNENLLDGSLSPTRSVRGGPDQRSQTFEGPSIDQSELLRFTTLTHRNGVVDCDWKPVRISIAAELQGNFFLATPEPSRSAELTFSRRNLFQVTGSVSKIPKPCYLLDHKGGRTAILNVDVCVTGTESKEGKQIDVVHVPRKTTRLPSSPYVDYHTSPSPHPIRLEPEADVQVSSGELTLPFVWKRLQFKNSTANNGRRNGVQQKYRLKLTLTANLATGEKVSIIEAESGAIIVRGRSAWTSALDDETDGSPRERRRLGQVVVRRPRNAYRTDDSISRNENSPVAPSNQTAAPSPVVARLKERPPLLESDSAFENLNSVYEQTNSLHSRPESTTSMTNTIDFRLTERYLTGDSLYFGATNEESSTTKTSTPSYMDPDPLYEYFPLGIEAWMPPVDAVYRPHVAHNTSLAPDLQALVDKQDFSWTGPHTGKPSNWV